jgi:phosphate starvation-inducible membrane PsiE
MYIMLLVSLIMNLNQLTQQFTETINSFDIKNPNHVKFFTGVAIVCIGIYSLNFISMILSVIIGVVYPVLKSYNSIKTKNYDDMENILMYWIFFGLYTFVEALFGLILQTIPFYYTLKSALFGWAIYSNGAKYLYETFLCPKIEEYDADKVNEFVRILTGKVNEAMTEYENLKQS